jgi:dipeptidase D
LTGKDPEVTAIHAGLECGLLGERVPGLDMISFGPDIRGAHSPDERIHVGSVGNFWKLLVNVLDDLSK